MLRSLALQKYWKTAAMAATSFTGDSLWFVLDYLLRFLRVALLLAIWRTILAGKETAGMSLDAVLTYTLIATAFADPLASRTGLDTALWNGSIATRFLQPMGVVGHFVAEMMGGWLFGFAIFTAPLLLAAPLLGVSPLPASVGAGLLFVISLALGVTVGVALDFIFAALMVAFNWTVWDVERLRAAVGTVLSGSLLPLALLPWGLGEVFAWLPFAAMAWAPLSVYTGTGDPLRLMVLQVAWAAALWPLAQWLWRINRQKVVVYGG
ncbi:MAG: ABC-2 family transporter protein [Chloroflexota bacterium]